MKIDFVVYASVTQFIPGSVAGKPIEIDIPDRAKVNDILEKMGIPSDMALILLINGRAGVKIQELQENDD